MPSPDFTSIITHPGSAHKDDFLACCVLIATNAVDIFRREPTTEELDVSQTCVVDVGHRHEPVLNNFDHHQFPRDDIPTCSLSLVLQNIGMYEDARLFCDWLETSEWLDCRGPVDTSIHLGISRDALAKLNSPIDITLLRRFAASTEHKPGEPVYEVMRMIGEDLLEFINTLRSRIAFIEEHAEIWPFSEHGDNSKVVFIPRTDPMPDDPSMGLGRFIEARGLTDTVVGTIYPDRRGKGYGLSRFNDFKGLDFTQIEVQEDVHFAHSRGFVAKTSATCPERLRELMTTAFTQ